MNSKLKKTTEKIKETQVVISRDEMNLAEFPLAVLSTRVNSKIKTLEFNDSIINKQGKVVKRNWIITGTDKFGLPTSSDEEVLLGLMKLTVDSNFEKQKVYFSRYELLQILKWAPEGRNYTRLQKALDRLTGVRIKATNAFYDNSDKKYRTKNFGVLDAYEINDGREGGKQSFFIWSEEIFNSFQAGFIKKLDLNFYLDLKSAVSKRLYRYLDKLFWYKSKLKINVFELAHEKIGISRNYKYLSLLRQQLDYALDELIERDFLSGYEYYNKGKRAEIVIYSFNAKPRCLGETKISSKSDISHLDLISLLEKRGIKRTQAINISQNKTHQQIKKIKSIIEYFDHLVFKKSNSISKNPAGFLYSAVKKCDEFILPKEQRTNKNNYSKLTPVSELSNKKVIDKNVLLETYNKIKINKIIEIKNELEPKILDKYIETIDKKLSSIKSTISKGAYESALNHSVDEKIFKDYKLASFSDWTKTNQI